MTAQTRKLDHQSFMNRFLPILNWLPSYQRTWLRGDVLAGLTVLACHPRQPFTLRRLAC